MDRALFHILLLFRRKEGHDADSTVATSVLQLVHKKPKWQSKICVGLIRGSFFYFYPYFQIISST